MSYLELAKIVKAQGIKGEVKLQAFVDNLSRFAELPHVFLKRNGSYEKCLVERAWVYKGYAYVKLSGCDDRNEAELLRGQMLYIDKEHAIAPEEGYFIADLLGFAVQDTAFKKLGILKDVIQTGGVDVYEVLGEDGRTLLFPLAPGVVEDTDMQKGIITVNKENLAEVCVYA